MPPRANSPMASLPSSTAPASRSLRTAVASVSGTRCSMTLDWAVVRTPLVSNRSLSATGIPWRRPRYRPRMTSASATRACSSAASGSTVT